MSSPASTAAATAIQVTYLVTAFLFIMGLKRMSSPVTARSGILWAGAGMVIATLATFFAPGMTNYPLIIIAVLIGGVIAWVSGRRVAMTDIPQMIALYNGMGGGAAAAIAAVELYRGSRPESAVTSLAVLGGIIGAVSFSGSLIAFAKLQGLIRRSLRFGGQQVINLLILLVVLVLGALLILGLHTGGTAAGRVDDRADRRRRHAGGDLAVQRVHGPRGGVRGLCARQCGDDRRRNDRRLRRHTVDAVDG
jgi:NAD(P) transhydrogenase subunit beta